MQGGGSRDKEAALSEEESDGQQDVEDFTLAHFSDYAIKIMNQRFDDRSYWFDADNEWIDDQVWAEQGAGWFWSDSNNRYNRYNGNGTGRPINKDTEIYSILIAGSRSSEGGDTRFGLVYPPIGPYTANLRTTFDPRKPADMTALAAAGICPDNGCDLSLRIVFNGDQTSVYTLEESWGDWITQTDYRSFFERGFNLPAQGTTIESIELIVTPNAQTYTTAGSFPATPQVLSRWPYE
jgi:hypothetical protein